MFPTLQTLLRIAMVFSVDLDHFFADHRKRRAFAIVRHAARQRFPEAAGRRDPAYHFESLTFPIAEPKCEAYVATFHPVAEGKARPHDHAGVELIYVLSGELGVTVEATEHVLESGDALYFDASVPHSYRRTGRNRLLGADCLRCLTRRSDGAEQLPAFRPEGLHPFEREGVDDDPPLILGVLDPAAGTVGSPGYDCPSNLSSTSRARPSRSVDADDQVAPAPADLRGDADRRMRRGNRREQTKAGREVSEYECRTSTRAARAFAGDVDEDIPPARRHSGRPCRRCIASLDPRQILLANHVPDVRRQCPASPGPPASVTPRVPPDDERKHGRRQRAGHGGIGSHRLYYRPMARNSRCPARPCRRIVAVRAASC